MRSASFVRELATAGLRADLEQRVPRLPFFDAYPEFASLEVALGTVAYRPGNFDPLEQYAIAALARLRAPRRIFEFGTYDGATSLLLARNAPTADVFTIDLPLEQAALATVSDEIANAQAGNVSARDPKPNGSRSCGETAEPSVVSQFESARRAISSKLQMWSLTPAAIAGVCSILGP